MRPAVALLALCLAFAAPCLAQQTDQQPTPRIGTVQSPPFVMRGVGGAWVGISVALLSEVAGRAGFHYELVDLGAADPVDAVAAGRVDGAIAAIVPSADGERLVDFSNGYFQSGLAAAVSSTQPVPVLDMLRALGSREFRGVLWVLMALTVVFGALVWVLERRWNRQFEATPARGLFSGFWWATSTMTTVGYGDKAPITVAGRLLGIVWMILTMGLVALATAQLSAVLTADRLNGRLSSPRDLARLHVGVVAGGPAVLPVESLGARVQAFPTLAEGLTALIHGEVDAFVHDEAELAWQGQVLGGITLAPIRLQPVAFAMALPEGSALREPINRAILDTLGSPAWLGTLRYYLGPS